MSLYRNYRPKDFPSLVGQEHIKVTLLNAVKHKQLGHAYLFTGPRGTGKTTVARLLAKALNSEKMTEDGRFDDCDLAAEIDQGRLIDVLEIDAASNRGIDEIRDLREKINFAPTRAKNKVYIIDEVHMLTKEAFNALLKTLEEPPSFVFFILATTEIHKVPETIISRCQRFDFRRIANDDILRRLIEVCQSEGFTFEVPALEMIAKQSRGGLRDALSLLEQCASNKQITLETTGKMLGKVSNDCLEDLFTAMKNGEASKAMEMVTDLYQNGSDLQIFNKDYLAFLREKMLAAASSTPQKSVKELLEQMENFLEAGERAKFSFIPQLPLEIAIMKSIKSPISANTQQPTKPIETATVIAPSPAPAMPSTPSPTSTPVATAFSADNLMSNWALLIEKCQNTALKRNLQLGKLSQNGNEIILSFDNNFFMEQLSKPEALYEAKKMVNEIYGEGVSLKVTGSVSADNAAFAVFGDAIL